MCKKRITLSQAKEFHGHLGPWLVLGILMGDLARRILKAKKYFGMEVKVWGAQKKPKSCLIDGLQLSTGATFGKGNIQKLNSRLIKVEFYNRLNHKKVTLRLRLRLLEELKAVKTHKAAINLAKNIYRLKPDNLFIINKSNCLTWHQVRRRSGTCFGFVQAPGARLDSQTVQD